MSHCHTKVTNKTQNGRTAYEILMKQKWNRLQKINPGARRTYKLDSLMKLKPVFAAEYVDECNTLNEISL